MRELSLAIRTVDSSIEVVRVADYFRIALSRNPPWTGVTPAELLADAAAHNARSGGTWRTVQCLPDPPGRQPALESHLVLQGRRSGHASAQYRLGILNFLMRGISKLRIGVLSGHVLGISWLKRVVHRTPRPRSSARPRRSHKPEGWRIRGPGRQNGTPVSVRRIWEARDN